MGCVHVDRSLRTDSRSLAIRLSRKVAAAIDTMFEAKRLEIGLPVEARLLPSPPLSETVVETIELRSQEASATTSGLTLSQVYRLLRCSGETLVSGAGGSGRSADVRACRRWRDGRGLASPDAVGHDQSHVPWKETRACRGRCDPKARQVCDKRRRRGAEFPDGGKFLDIDMQRAADLLGMERRQTERIRDLQRGHFWGWGRRSADVP